jgi:hypothetical protein
MSRHAHLFTGTSPWAEPQFLRHTQYPSGAWSHWFPRGESRRCCAGESKRIRNGAPPGSCPRPSEPKTAGTVSPQGALAAAPRSCGHYTRLRAARQESLAGVQFAAPIIAPPTGARQEPMPPPDGPRSRRSPGRWDECSRTSGLDFPALLPEYSKRRTPVSPSPDA